jgi:RNA polymerase sigma-B factor
MSKDMKDNTLPDSRPVAVTLRSSEPRRTAGDRPVRDGRSADEFADVVTMVAALRAMPERSQEYARQYESIVSRCCPLAERVARHFDRRGESLDDLVQVARVGLLLAINRFDTTRNSSFVAFAVPTMMGECRRHFRDYSWKVHVPRRIRDQQHDIKRATADLTHALGRSPSIDELAGTLGKSRDEIVECLLAANAYQPDSIDAAANRGEGGALTVADSVGEIDSRFDLITDRETVKPLLAALPARDQKVLYLRYFASKTQREIAEDIGVSQMHVSRILDSALRDLRRQVAA